MAYWGFPKGGRPFGLSLHLQVFHWLEFYAGRGNATLAMKTAGHTSGSLDLLYFKDEGSNYYDINTNAGMAPGAKLRACHH